MVQKDFGKEPNPSIVHIRVHHDSTLFWLIKIEDAGELATGSHVEMLSYELNHILVPFFGLNVQISSKALRFLYFFALIELEMTDHSEWFFLEE